jgi:hypothetical protein
MRATAREPTLGPFKVKNSYSASGRKRHIEITAGRAIAAARAAAAARDAVEGARARGIPLARSLGRARAPRRRSVRRVNTRAGPSSSDPDPEPRAPRSSSTARENPAPRRARGSVSVPLPVGKPMVNGVRIYPPDANNDVARKRRSRAEARLLAKHQRKEPLRRAALGCGGAPEIEGPTPGVNCRNGRRNHVDHKLAAPAKEEGGNPARSAALSVPIKPSRA